MAKNVKSLIIFARDCLRWSCLGVSCPKFEILPNSSDQIDVKLTYFNQTTQSFCPQNVEILQGGCAGEWARIKYHLILLIVGKNKVSSRINYHLLTREISLGK
jgi:hypothetical protein